MPSYYGNLVSIDWEPSSCGSPLWALGTGRATVANPVAPVPVAVFCQYCESELDADTKKCPNCGGPRRRPGQR